MIQASKEERRATIRPMGSFEVGGRSGWSRLTSRLQPSPVRQTAEESVTDSPLPPSMQGSSARSVDLAMWVTASGGVALIVAWFFYSVV